MKNKIKLFILLSMYLIGTASVMAQSPAFTWARQSEGLAGNGAKKVCTDASGNVIVIGSYQSSIVFGSDTLINGTIFIVKYDASGNVLWAKSDGGPVGVYGDYASAVSTDGIGNIYITGEFTGPFITFGTDTLFNEFFVVKYDPMGNVLWAKGSATWAVSGGTGIANDAAGNVLVSGVVADGDSITFGSISLINAGGFDLFLVKYDPLGNVLWAKSAGGIAEDKAQDVSIDPTGNSYITGYFKSPSITFGSITLTNTGPLYIADMYVAKYDPSGNVLWAKSRGTTLYDEADIIATDANGNSYVSGFLNSHVIVAGIDMPIDSGTTFIMKYDSAGTALWTKNMGVVTPSMAIDMNGNLLLTGGFGYGTVVFGMDTLINTNPATNDIYIVKCDSSANTLWAKSAGGSGNEIGSSICVDASGNIIVAGYFNSPTITFGTSTLTNDSAGSFTDLFVVKLNNVTNVVWPGDANYNYVVDNNDLLPIGLYYGQTGPLRMVTGNVWQADTCTDWGLTETTGVNIKNADCNGDGIIDSNDTLAVSLNFSLAHAFAPIHTDERSINPNLYFTSSSGIYLPGAWINVDVMAGASAFPVNNLYGLAFNIHYDESLVQAGTESLIYPNSWFGSPGTDAIKIGKVDALASTAYAGETRINHTNKDGYGKIATFRFQAKTTISSPSTINFSYSNYMANDSAGSNMVFSPQTYSVIIDPSASVSEIGNVVGINIYPNPYSASTQISYVLNSKAIALVEVFDVIGNIVETLVNTTQPAGEYKYNFSAKEKGFDAGVYFVKITIDGTTATRKIVEMK
jgi:hypothetical protein